MFSEAKLMSALSLAMNIYKYPTPMHVTCLSSTEHQKSESATQECYALLKDPGDGTPDIAIESTPDI